MCITDKYPTEYNLAPVDLRAPASPASPVSITDLELRALRAVDVAERVADPVNRFSIARGVVRGVAFIARRVRRSGGES